MSSTGDHAFKSIKMTGAVNVKAFKPGDQWEYPKSLILVMGPTGAGKSSFIEALAGPDSAIRNLSSDGLDGYTQDVTAYQVQGIKAVRANIEFAVYLIDTPGFGDDKVSVHEVVAKTKDYLKAPGRIPYVLFFAPITSSRLPGSQRQVVNAFKSLMGTQASGGLTIVTTMWDTLWSQTAKERAETSFEQLTSDIWKEYTNEATMITRFHNTRASALQVLDFAFLRYREEQFNVEETIAHMYIHPSKTLFYEDVCTDLEDRIHSLTMKKQLVVSDLFEIAVSGNEDLQIILESELREIDTTLAKFEQQLAYLYEQRPVTSPAPSDVEIPVLSDSKKAGRMTRLKESTRRLVDRISRRDDH